MTERRLTLELTPEDAAVFSRSAATLGAHRTLAGPPGAALLGWAASQIYDDLGEHAHAVFHTGRVRFSDAVRWAGDKAHFANPATLFEPKHGEGQTVLGRDEFYGKNPGVQPEAIKGRWLTLKGSEAAKPGTQRRMRTATCDGKAADGQLFGYEAVEPTGLRYRATIEADDSIGDAVWDRIVAAFPADGTIRLGRARATGYGGGYSCKRIEGDPALWEQPEPFVGTQIGFWLLSDALLLDDWGAPRVEAHASDFGLAEGWKLLPTETSVTMRRAWPWNRSLDEAGTRGGRDNELALIEAGSVISFKWGADGSPPATQPQGLIGFGRERGFGRVAVLDTKFAYIKYDEKTGAAEAPVKPGNSTIVTWASDRAAARANGDSISWEEQQIVEVLGLIARAGPDGPGPSQWSGLEPIAARLARGGKDFSPNELRGDVWRARLVPLDDWVKDKLFAISDTKIHAELQRHRIQIIKAARAKAQELRR